MTMAEFSIAEAAAGTGWRAWAIGRDAWFVQRGWLNSNHFVARAPAVTLPAVTLPTVTLPTVTLPTVTLIDTAHGDDSAVTLEVLRGLGIAPESVDTILNTHEHPDHTGGNAALHRLSGCRIRMHPVAAARVRERDGIRTCWQYYDTRLWGEWCTVHDTIAEGEAIAFGSLELEARAAPGHTAGQMVFVAPRQKYLFSADAYWAGDMGVLNHLVDGEDVVERAIETLTGLLRLEPAVAFPGHGPAIPNPAPGMRRCLKKLERFLAQPTLAHGEHLRKSATYVLLIRGGLPEAGFFEQLMASVWFPALVDRYLGGDHRGVYEQTLGDMLRLRMVERQGDRLVATGAR